MDETSFWAFGARPPTPHWTLPLDANPAQPAAPAFARTTPKDAPPAPAQSHPCNAIRAAQIRRALGQDRGRYCRCRARSELSRPERLTPIDSRAVASRTIDSPTFDSPASSARRSPVSAQRISNSSLAPSSRKEGYATKNLFSNFWRRQHEAPTRPKKPPTRRLQ